VNRDSVTGLESLAPVTAGARSDLPHDLVALSASAGPRLGDGPRREVENHSRPALARA